MENVDELFDIKIYSVLATRVLISHAATAELADFSRTEQPKQRFQKKLLEMAKGGFRHFEGEKRPIRPEGAGVFRIGETSSLFRLIGFYEDHTDKAFIALDAFVKSGQQLTRRETRIIERVQAAKKNGTWRRTPKNVTTQKPPKNAGRS